MKPEAFCPVETQLVPVNRLVCSSISTSKTKVYDRYSNMTSVFLIWLLVSFLFLSVWSFVGYNLAVEGGVKSMLNEFDQEVGLHYLKAIHLNDSKGAARKMIALTCLIDFSQQIKL